MSTKTQEVITQKVLEEKFSAGYIEFEALIDGVSEDSKSKLIKLLEQLTEK